MTHSWPQLLGRLLAGDDLAEAETAWALDRVMSDEATPAQLAGFLIALRAKGETAPEVAGLVRTMLAHAAAIEVPGPVVDVVGTGGDQSDSVNISTMAALVVAAAGERVVKHGNRAASSTTGSADVLERLGVRLDLAPAEVAAVVAEVGITFCFAPVFHPAMRFAGPTRRELGVPTVFNILGPLANPTRPAAMAVGCADPRLGPVMADVLAGAGVTAAVVRGDDGLDEVSVSAPTTVWRRLGDSVRAEALDVADLGIGRAAPDALRGGEAEANAATVRAVLGGQPGAVADAVAVNAAVALAAATAHRAGGWDGSPLVEALAVALPRAQRVLASGEALDLLDRWAAATQQRA